MSAHVVVIDSAARRHNIKTTPGKHLSDVLEEACGKIGLNASQYGLKHNNKAVDLSRTIRLSGLSSGAKLELVQLSRSAGVVSVALQLPQDEAQGTPNGRVTDKFPSTTTLWLVLRKFEAGVAGTAGTSRNLTAKGAPATNSGNAGAGRLFYQQPVIQVMGRELASFTDLQKTLAQLGFNTGSTLLRLSYRTTDTPLEESLTQIQQYFDSVDAAAAPASAPVTKQNSQPSTTEQTAQRSDDTSVTDATTTQTAVPEQETTQPETTEDSTTLSQQLPPSTTESKPESRNATVGTRPVSVYKAPKGTTPSAALATYNEADFTPTVEHAQIHQKMLQQSSLNKRLLTDAEIDRQAKEEAEKLALIKDVEIKIRFPDQSSVSAKFTNEDTSAELYHFARGCLDENLRTEPFILRNPGVRGKGEVLPDSEKSLLIKDQLLKGRVLVVFGWADEASAEARGARNVLKAALRSQAQDVKAPSIPGSGAEKDEDPGIKVNVGKKDEADGAEGSSSKKLPKWLKGLSKR